MKKVVNIILFILLAVAVKAQDPEFSQLFNNRVYLNPAFTGLEVGHRVSATTRALWSNLPKDLNTYSFTYEHQPCDFRRVGIGITAMQDVEGEGRLKSTDVAGVFAFHTYYSLKRSRPNQTAGSFSMALQMGYTSRSVDWSKLVFGDQLDPVAGVISPSSSQAAAQQGTGAPDIGYGVLFRQRIQSKSKGSQSRDITFHLGAAAHHITQPRIGFTNGGRLPIKLTVHTGLLVQLSKNDYLIPAVRYITQDFRQVKHSMVDINLMYLRHKIFGGASYRRNQFKRNEITNRLFANTDAIMFFAGMEFDYSKRNALRLTYSFDTNFKGVSRGDFFTHEISLVLIIGGNCDETWQSRSVCDYQKKKIPQIF